MRLLDMAEVHVGDGHWMKGWEAEDRAPGLDIEVFDPCGALDVSVVDSVGPTSPYRIEPFGVKAGFPRSLMCSQDDDEKWLDKTVKDTLERAIGLAMCVNHSEGTETWIGDDDVVEETSTGTMSTDVASARATWLANNPGTPTLHVSDDLLPGLLGAHIIVADPKEGIATVWGDPVVNSPGYLTGVAFWSGPVEIYVSSTDTDMIFNVRNNASRVIGNLIAAIDMSPYQIVRVGAAPVQPAGFSAMISPVGEQAASPVVSSVPVAEPFSAQVLSGFDSVAEPTEVPEPGIGEPTVEVIVDPGDWTISEIKDWVGTSPSRAQQALAAENQRETPRVTLVAWLEDLLAD